MLYWVCVKLQNNLLWCVSMWTRGGGGGKVMNYFIKKYVQNWYEKKYPMHCRMYWIVILDYFASTCDSSNAGDAFFSTVSVKSSDIPSGCESLLWSTMTLDKIATWTFPFDRVILVNLLLYHDFWITIQSLYTNHYTFEQSTFESRLNPIELPWQSSLIFLQFIGNLKIC